MVWAAPRIGARGLLGQCFAPKSKSPYAGLLRKSEVNIAAAET